MCEPQVLCGGGGDPVGSVGFCSFPGDLEEDDIIEIELPRDQIPELVPLSQKSEADLRRWVARGDAPRTDVENRADLPELATLSQESEATSGEVKDTEDATGV